MPFRERRASFLPEFSYRYPWRLLEQRHPLATLATSKHGQIGDDDVEDIRPGERQGTLREPLWLSRATHVIHHRDHTTTTGHHIHTPTPPPHPLARHPPIVEISSARDLPRPPSGSAPCRDK